MKATIDATGCLVVEAETELESYALSCWFDGWDKPLGEQTSLLRVTTIKPADELKGKQ